MQRFLRIAAIVALGASIAACQTTSVSFPNAEIEGAQVPQRTISATMSKPDGPGPFPAVVLLHTCGGVQPHVSTHWPDYLTGLGYVTMTVNSFGSRGLGACPNALHPAGTGPRQRDAMTNAYREITRDAYGALDYLAAQPYVDAKRVAVAGFSLGANVINSFLVKQKPRPMHNFASAIGVYGRCHDLAGAVKPALALMELAGELDPQHVESCRAVADKVELHVLPGAYHAWDSPQASGNTGSAGESMRYSAIATEQSRNLVKDFLARRLNAHAAPAS
jgi:dienelactone hydrolase